jgi:hypothetical protein
MYTFGGVQFYDMSTFVASCRTAEGALELARFMERKYPTDDTVKGDQVHQFVVMVSQDGKMEVHSTVAVNDLGRDDFKKFVLEFTTLKMRKPIQTAVRLTSAVRRIA